MIVITETALANALCYKHYPIEKDYISALEYDIPSFKSGRREIAMGKRAYERGKLLYEEMLKEYTPEELEKFGHEYWG